MSEIYKRICGKKSVHIALTQNSHIALKLACTVRGLSMQEVFEEFVQRIIAEAPHMLKLLAKVAENKKNKTGKKFSKEDLKSIFDMLEEADPFK